MRDCANSKDLSAQIKAGLQICHKVLNQGKHPEKEYRLFNGLAELYLQKENIREYPKTVAIYQYLKKLVEKHQNNDQEKQVKLDESIGIAEKQFIERVTGKKVSDDYCIESLKKVREYKESLDENRGLEESEKYRYSIRAKLKEIEDLGIIEGQEELNEEGLKERADKIEQIYMGVREFFIGKRNEEAELIQLGLLNKLINDCIEQLGGLPRVGTDKHEVEYAVFGMGSMALGTMTPWSDLEFGVLIEEGLTTEEETKVKEYFRNLTTLLHIKVVNFGETLLRMIGIKELNNFKLTDKSDSEHNWFFDNLINSGFSFDGPHWHACKTPLGREKGYRKSVTKEDMEELELCNPYELLGTVDQFMGFYQKINWSKEDPELVQGLRHAVLITGAPELVLKHQQQSEKYKEVIESLAFRILKEDSQKLNPFKQILDKDKEGQILKVKKEIYRFPDRIIVALGDCLGGNGVSSWDLIDNIKKIGDKQKKDLHMALSIATEIRLRTYANNSSQNDDMSVIARYKSQVNELKSDELTKEIFYLRDIKILYKYYYITVGLSLKLTITENKQSLEEIDHLKISQSQGALMRGYTYKRFLKYYDAIKEFETLDCRKNVFAIDTLAELYSSVGRYEEALKLYMHLKSLETHHASVAAAFNDVGNTLERLGRFEQALEWHKTSLGIICKIHKGYHADIATTMNNIGSTLVSLGKLDEALKYLQESLEMRRRIYKGDHISIADSLSNIGNILNCLSRFDEALEFKRKGLKMRCRVYKGDHVSIAESLNNMGNTLGSLDKYDEALKYLQESLEMRRRIYKGDHADIATSLNNIGNILESLGEFEEALKHLQESLEMRRRIYKGDHAFIAASLSNIGSTLVSLGKLDEALKYLQESLEMRRRIYKGDHISIADSLSNIGSILGNLGKYDEALKYQQESLNIKRRIYKYDHHGIAISLNNIGNILESLGKFEEALKYIYEGLEMRRRIYKGDHMDIASSLNNAGVTLQSLGNFEEALKYLHESLEMKRRIYKKDHVIIADSLNNIGVILQRLGRFDEALKYKLEGLEMRRKIYNGDHLDIADSLNNIGVTLQNLERFDDALRYYQESLEMQRKIYVGAHTSIADSLNNIGVTLQCLGRLNEALKYQQESLEIRSKIYSEDHISIASSLYNIGNTLGSLGRFEEALKYSLESLGMRRKTYKTDHVDIAASLNSIGITLQNLDRYNEAIKYIIQSITMFRNVLPLEHPYLQMVQRQLVRCTVALANKEILLGNFNKALDYYASIGFGIKIENLSEITYSFALQFWQKADLDMSINCYESLSKKLARQNRGFKHNLACMYHIKGLKKEEQGHKEKFAEYLIKAKIGFEEALSSKLEGGITTSTYVEYSQFLLKHYNKVNQEEYSKVIVLLETATKVDDNSSLGYNQLEKPTACEALQTLLSRQDEVQVKPYLLAYYLLIKAHCMHNNIEQAEVVLKEFQVKAQGLKGSNEEELAQYLLDWGCRELKSQKLQQLVISQLTDLLESNMYAIAERRDITTVILSQSLPYNHIGVIWDYYSECRIMCVFKHELRQIFNSILSSSSEVLRIALSQNDKHVDIVMSYLDEEIVISENFETRVITARKENKAVMKELSMST